NTFYSLNQQHQVIELTNRKTASTSGAVISDFSDIMYNAAGNHTGHTETFPGRTAVNGSVVYGFDNKDRLTSEQKTGDAAPIYYAPGAFGNLNEGGVGYNSADQLTSFGAQHDAAGNQTSIPDSSLLSAGYDTTNHMTSIGTGGFTMGYYADGSRMWKQIG